MKRGWTPGWTRGLAFWDLGSGGTDYSHLVNNYNALWHVYVYVVYRCSDMLTFGKPNSSRQWYNNSLSSLIFIFLLNIWRNFQYERPLSLRLEYINTTYSQRFTSDSLTIVWRIFSLPLSSNCRSLNQISLKEPGFVTLRDVFGLLQPYDVDDCRENCIHAVSSTVRWLCALFSFSHTNAVLS
jgi:hypothetical protein